MIRPAKIAGYLLLAAGIVVVLTGLSPVTLAAEPPSGTAAGEIYREAFGSYAVGRYREAGERFTAFLGLYPEHRFAADARFWLADGHYRGEAYQAAIDEFEKLLEQYPATPKRPEALLKIVAASMRLGDSAGALRAAALLDKDFPQSEAARKARQLAQP